MCVASFEVTLLIHIGQDFCSKILYKEVLTVSFASETKKELTKLEMKECCEKAELSALLRMNGSLSFSNRRLSIDIQTENATNCAKDLYTFEKGL